MKRHFIKVPGGLRPACSVEGCDRPTIARGWCRLHYDRWRAHGDPNRSPKTAAGEPMRWLISHAAYAGDDCLIWPFARFPDGRAHMHKKKPTRVMCELANGKAPSARHEAAHRCGNGHEACVNPRHLYWATKRENEADKIKHGTVARGSKLPQSKLTEGDVRTIRVMASTMLQKEIAALYDVNKTCIHKVVTRRSWRHVE